MRSLVWTLGLLALTPLAAAPWTAAVAAGGTAVPLDLDADQAAEVARWQPLESLPGPGPAAPGVLLLVEERLTQPGTGPDLQPALAGWLRALTREGWAAAAVATAVYAGPRHQDGLTLLALRRCLQAVRREYPNLQAVVLVGAFPDALLVRQYAWWKHEPLTLRRKQPDEQTFKEPVHFLRAVPEVVAMRADIVLGDLDGRWDEVYHLPRTKLPTWYLVYPQGRTAAAEGATAAEQGGLEFEDFFLAQDGALTVRQEGARWHATVAPEGNAECAPADLTLANPLPLPELAVSRLDARHAAVMPDPQIVDAQGRHLLDAQGRPQALEFATAEVTPHPHRLWVLDERREREMLLDWCARRQRWSAGAYQADRRPANIGIGWGSSVQDARRALPEWADFREPGYDILKNEVTLTEVVDWLHRPAVFRAMKAHGDPWGCAWAKAPDAKALDQAVGGVIYNWRREGSKLTPTLAGTTAKLDFAVTRSLYEGGTLPDTPALWLYTACEGTAPAHAAEAAYNSPGYGFWQGSECLLFHLRGLALIGRSKVFYDQPRELWPVLAAGGTLGDVWRRYFTAEAADASLLAKNGIGRKRATFWNVVGDCTVRLLPPPP
ncbi:MAG: hypothetical protein IT204_16260 [Fimbriimonadaceae bacterium]|nr:hypothetical protein [Fimbriimonadaceae bacterium]